MTLLDYNNHVTSATINLWLSAQLWYLQCVSNGDTTINHQLIDTFQVSNKIFTTHLLQYKVTDIFHAITHPLSIKHTD